jgi:MYXO-CTERM domain-containing protein
VVVNTGAFTANVDPNTNHTVSPNGTLAIGTTEGGGVRVDHSNPVGEFLINTTHYFSFSFTADAPGVLLQAFSLDFAHPSTGATAAGFRGFEVQYSVEGGAFASAGWGRLQGHTNSGNRAVNYELDLDDVALADGETVEFRIYKTNANGSGNEVRYDNFMLSGVAIPEPATAGLGLFGALMLVGRRRRA